ncbi:FabD/lysophospholipase-like protein [Lindgomyces ingoldianus]|uniref:FabD/lysophospholipase-like protein n=1 Tax=Lindgomyces ingoldianus TaxID=673940 RepID=A0ACB6QY41_9PLEO|nr:FabD/lysophospholipase-like protein [Lindgomyces ingoldianus]KAF2471780.1 FabD/lysophospholipase-like protein [Lindgomyces ingoldianus]
MASEDGPGPSIAPESSKGKGKAEWMELPDGISQGGSSSTPGLSVVEVWNQQNLLSLDGGGIRGYWTLLVLKRLMDCIAHEEQQQTEGDSDEYHSFHPCPFPEHVTGPLSSKESDALNRPGAEHRRRTHALRTSRKFLPCHYFDYICGSSTGGLIAIMLGRFRMTVQDCLYEYKEMGNKIFGKPRLVSQPNTGIISRPKYSASALEEVFKDVTARRCEHVDQRIKEVTFPSMPGLCNTFVTTKKRERRKGSKGSEEKKYLIRSYDHEKSDPHIFQRNRTTTLSTKAAKTNFGPADPLEIWEVARAATAAPMYFEEIKFKRRTSTGSTKIFFTDGGFGHTNNPTQEGLSEIKSLHGESNIGVVVSVGTARAKEDPGGRSIRKRIRKLANTATDPGIVEGYIDDARLDHSFRLNDEKGINIDLDEWKPNGAFTSRPGHKTLADMKHAFNKWCQKSENSEAFTRCAKELVRRRRIRMEDSSRWERYATGARFVCGYSACGNTPHYDREAFRRHLWTEHPESREDIDVVIRRMTKTWKYQIRPPP